MVYLLYPSRTRAVLSVLKHTTERADATDHHGRPLNFSAFKARYATIGFSDKANLDEGNMWATAFALTKLTKADEKRIAELVKQAMS